MTDKDLLVKDLSITIQRGKHDKENPYVMISKKMLRDKELSPKSKGVLCYLLSLPDTWQAHPRQVAKSIGVGKDLIYTVLSELLRLGYANKKEIKEEKGRFKTVLYEFYEERLPEELRYKEKSTVSANPDTDNPDTETPTLKNIDSIDHTPKGILTPPIPPLPGPAIAVAAKAAEVEIKDSPEEKPKKARTPPDFSPKVKEVADQMVNSLVRTKPDYIPPRNLSAFLTHVDYLLRLDKRDPIKVMDVFNWALADAFWADKMFKPNPAEYLRKQFDQLEMKMNAKPTNPNQVDRRLRDKDGNTVDNYKDRMF